MARRTVVIDPGHGGTVELGGSSANNATSPSGVLEKNMTLRLGMLVRDALTSLAAGSGQQIDVMLTRDTDRNVALAERAALAAAKQAEIFVSIHFNASEGHNARGVETLVSPRDRNSNHAEDVALAQRVQDAVFRAIKTHDPNTRDRKVKDQPLAVLNERHLGKATRGCLLEVEFIDIPAVDQLLNLNANAPDVRKDIATAIASAVLDDLRAH